MGVHEIQEEREGSYTRRIAHPGDSSKPFDFTQGGFTDLGIYIAKMQGIDYMAMMRRLNRYKHKREFKHWGPGP